MTPQDKHISPMARAEKMADVIISSIQEDVDYFSRCARGKCGDFKYNTLVPLIAQQIEEVTTIAREQALAEGDAQGYARGLKDAAKVCYKACSQSHDSMNDRGCEYAQIAESIRALKNK